MVERDGVYWLTQINKASLVVLVGCGLLSESSGAAIAEVISQLSNVTVRRSSLSQYLTYESEMISAIGPEASLLHIGRSQIDINRTRLRLIQRLGLLETHRILGLLRSALLDFVEPHLNQIIPAYTLGVQAQPTSLGHYILGYVNVLQRHADRFRNAYATVNRSPLGAAALGTSSFAIDRSKLASLLGFDAPITNSFDAVHLAPVDSGMEIAYVASSTAITIGQLMADFAAQYRAARPWLTLVEGELTSSSSLMPQKRNPAALNALRLAASRLLGECMTYQIQAHNVTHGVVDYAGGEPAEVLKKTAEMCSDLHLMIRNCRFDRTAALSEVEADYGTATELANVLLRKSGVPFRTCHHFVSELVDIGRKNGLTPSEISYATAQNSYEKALSFHGLEPAPFPLNEPEFRAALDPTRMIENAKGLGGPQPTEVSCMLDQARKQIDNDTTWRDATVTALESAEARLEAEFRLISAKR